MITGLLAWSSEDSYNLLVPIGCALAFCAVVLFIYSLKRRFERLPVERRKTISFGLWLAFLVCLGTASAGIAVYFFSDPWTYSPTYKEVTVLMYEKDSKGGRHYKGSRREKREKANYHWSTGLIFAAVSLGSCVGILILVTDRKHSQQQGHRDGLPH